MHGLLMHARPSDVLTILFGSIAIFCSLDLVGAVYCGGPWRRPLAAMLLCLILATGAHLLASAL
jgi:hypothetical protein